MTAMLRLCSLALPLLAAATASTACLERRPDDTNPEQDECTPCHGGLLEAPNQAAPPYSLAGETSPAARGVGAHEAHLFPGDDARPLECEECHVVPEEKFAPGHMDDPYPAEVVFQGPAFAFEASPSFDPETQTCQNTFCHGGYFVGGRPSGGTHPEPVWTSDDGAAGDCGGCHGLPPPPPHPDDDACHDCHKNIRDDERTFSHPLLHVDGNVDFFLPGTGAANRPERR